ncbi:MAG: hypothetical protein A2729_02350 [Candidatus Buchananbacteria bacterium RIFCSPHIGHO2_01_FULL_39_14]|uniref:Glycosyltransferase 2-like domain-containing protein n=1 Tax=Candidatus Buchananbacteria bacterium RIFCSPHIGHO2_01_FULL_39_14 TaxID=1797532 RepID=A0A1G1XWU7_9BACT|nr:MAG: hypothetical protein A2729_02350 [Candidatus Buchananbacteria bacterium RIFCSPHIGHO2_01_FULL_39_14]
MKVSIQIVTWNSMRYIFDCLESLMRQSFRDFSVLVIDNGSDDGTVNFIRSNYPTVSVLQNFKNLGYAKANNQGILLANSDYVLVMNPDVILTDEFLAEIVAFAEQKPDGASFGGKILKMQSEAIDQDDVSGLRQAVKSDIIDSAGLQIFKSRRIVNRGENDQAEDQSKRPTEIFGLSGACVLYRKQALTDVMIKNDFFDSDFFAYKEDVDLAWRLRLYGWTNWYVPKAVSFHHRHLALNAENGFYQTFQNRRQISKILRQLSFRNHHLLLVKNDLPLNLILNLPWFLGRELKIIIYSLIFEPFQWRGGVEFFQYLPGALIKRRVIMGHRKISAKEIRKWFK